MGERIENWDYDKCMKEIRGRFLFGLKELWRSSRRSFGCYVPVIYCEPIRGS